jgi:predicted transcriptional regulator
MASTTFTVRVEPTVKKRLERLAKSTGRSRSFLAAEAISEYLDINEWQVAGIKQAITSLDSGKGVPHLRRAGQRGEGLPGTPADFMKGVPAKPACQQTIEAGNAERE